MQTAAIELAIEQTQGVLEAAGGSSSQFLDHDSAQFTQILSERPHRFQLHYYSFLFLAAKLSSFGSSSIEASARLEHLAACSPEWMKFSHFRLTYSGFPGHFVIELRIFGLILAGVGYSAYLVFLRQGRS